MRKNNHGEYRIEWRYGGVAGFFDPLRSYIWAIYDPKDPLLITHNHEYNHLIGILGRHLQICLLDYYILHDFKQCEIICETERPVIESFVAAFLYSSTRFPAKSPLAVAPQCNEIIFNKIIQICHHLENCKWIINGVKVSVVFEQIERAVQQVVLNLADKGSMYSPGSSIKALDFLTRLTEEIKNKAVFINRVLIGEYYRMEVRVAETYTDRDISGKTDSPPLPMEVGDSIEMFLANLIKEGTGLEIKRYTLHERVEMILRWIYQILRSSDEILIELLTGIISVFAPGMFTPLVAFWQQPDSSRYNGELYALPFGHKPLYMPIMTQTLKDKRVLEHQIIPTSWITLRGLANNIRQQSDCELACAIADFYDFTLGEIILRPFRERVEDIAINLGQSLKRILDSFKHSDCEECSSLIERLDKYGNNYNDALSQKMGNIIEQAGKSYTEWLIEHSEHCFENANNVPVRVSDKGNNVFRYIPGPSILKL
jgi:hypothetical protein